MGVLEAIREADTLLPGEPADEGLDPRWQAIIAVGEYIASEPQAVWGFICRWGCHPQEDLRDAIATCLLEHLLEYHFALYFPRVRELALAEPLFADTFLRCWQFGQSKEPSNAEKFKALSEALLERCRAEQAAAPDRGRSTAFQSLSSLRRPRQVSLVVRRRIARGCHELAIDATGMAGSGRRSPERTFRTSQG